MVDLAGFEPPPYPYDRLEELRPEAERFPGGCVDLSIGTPTDPPAPAVLDALAHSDTERGYPRSVGSPALREAAAAWMNGVLGAAVEPGQVAACVGTKELVAGLPHLLRLRRPERDTVLYPAVSYPSYAMGATLAGCRAVPVDVDPRRGLDVDSIDPTDAERALCLWSNTPGNPAGSLDDLEAVAAWGRAHDVPVFSDECYVEYTWDGPPRSILQHGDRGVVAVHSLSKRSNLAGVRVGFYAGDPALVEYLSEVRKHAGLMVPGPAQAAAVAALADQRAVDEQRTRYLQRLERMRSILDSIDVEAELPRGGFYLWVRAPDGDAWAFTRRLAREAGALVSPGEFYGEAASDHVRLAMVRPLEQLDLIADRLGVA
jgi:succinyldiaminopimelate transaminase